MAAITDWVIARIDKLVKKRKFDEIGEVEWMVLGDWMESAGKC